jgi:hypothetical protein
MTTESKDKISWKIFLDLQCPYSRKTYLRLPELRQRFQDKYEITIHYTSLAFHPQAFTAQCAANVIGISNGPEARQAFQDKCFEIQERYMNAAIGDSRKSEIEAVFYQIANEAGCFSSTKMSKEEFCAKLTDWEAVVKPAWLEHKEALYAGSFATPSHVINSEVVQDTESDWGPDDWETKLTTLK